VWSLLKNVWKWNKSERCNQTHRYCEILQITIPLIFWIYTLQSIAEVISISRWYAYMIILTRVYSDRNNDFDAQIVFIVFVSISVVMLSYDFVFVFSLRWVFSHFRHPLLDIKAPIRNIINHHAIIIIIHRSSGLTKIQTRRTNHLKYFSRRAIFILYKRQIIIWVPRKSDRASYRISLS